MSQDTCTINSIDETNENNGYVIVSCTLSIGGNSYNQDFTVNAIDPVSVAASITAQAESYRQLVEATSTIVNGSDSLSTLDGEVIDL